MLFTHGYACKSMGTPFFGQCCLSNGAESHVVFCRVAEMLSFEELEGQSVHIGLMYL